MKIFCSYTTIFILIFATFLPGCSVYNNTAEPVTRPAAYPRVIERARKNNRSFIMHSGVDTFAITSLQVERRKQHVTVHLNRFDSLHRLQLTSPASLAAKRIHLYVQDTIIYTLDEPHTIPFNKVARIELVN